MVPDDAHWSSFVLDEPQAPSVQNTSESPGLRDPVARFPRNAIRVGPELRESRKWRRRNLQSAQVFYVRPQSLSNLVRT